MILLTYVTTVVRKCGMVNTLIRRIKKPKFSLCWELGQVHLPLLKESPELLKTLIHGDDEISKYFWKNIRQLNMVFSFTFIGNKVDRCVSGRCGPKMFQLQRENSHLWVI